MMMEIMMVRPSQFNACRHVQFPFQSRSLHPLPSDAYLRSCGGRRRRGRVGQQLQQRRQQTAHIVRAGGRVAKRKGGGALDFIRGVRERGKEDRFERGVRRQVGDATDFAENEQRETARVHGHLGLFNL